ncbi:MAG: hypothetical protein V4565_14440 [Bacteroidota bacterium]
MNHENLKKMKEDVLHLSPENAAVLKEYIGEVIKIFNYQDLKVHGNLNELLLTINTDNEPDPENFNDILKKFLYLIDLIITDF